MLPHLMTQEEILQAIREKTVPLSELLPHITAQENPLPLLEALQDAPRLGYTGFTSLKKAIADHQLSVLAGLDKELEQMKNKRTRVAEIYDALTVPSYTLDHANIDFPEGFKASLKAFPQVQIPQKVLRAIAAKEDPAPFLKVLEEDGRVPAEEMRELKERILERQQEIAAAGAKAQKVIDAVIGKAMTPSPKGVQSASLEPQRSLISPAAVRVAAG